jgi:UDP-N-acetylglucosamine acyltransferase
MSETKIHPTALVSPRAEIGANVQIGPNVSIEDDVQIGDNCEIRHGAIIGNGARLGNNVKVYAYAVVATEPQDLKYKNENTYVYIGDNTVLREFATINRGTAETGKTVVGQNCLIMTYVHIAHDCRVGDNVILSNVTQLGGHVTIEDWVNCGGVTKVHQFCTVGKHAFVGADCKIVKDVPPFTLIGRQPPRVEGINKIGLRRRGFSYEDIQKIELFYDKLLFSGMNNKDGIASAETGDVSDNVRYCIDFIRNSKRGIHR